MTIGAPRAIGDFVPKGLLDLELTDGHVYEVRFGEYPPAATTQVKLCAVTSKIDGSTHYSVTTPMETALEAKRLR